MIAMGAAQNSRPSLSPAASKAKVADVMNSCVASYLTPSIAVLDRQRFVHDAMKEEMKTIHAITLRTWTPAQWEEKRKQLGK